MDYVNLGSTGLRVSRICLGMMSYGKHESRPWTLDADQAQPIVRHAVEGGVTFFDTADVYNGGASEVLTGQLLRKLFGMREEYVLATKVHGDFEVVDRLAEVARERGEASARVALAWLLHKPGVTAPIVGATKPEHGGAAEVHDDQIYLAIGLRNGGAGLAVIHGWHLGFEDRPSGEIPVDPSSFRRQR